MPELIPAESGSPPVGWGATEYAEHRAQAALIAWDDRDHRGLYLDRAMALAETLRHLLAELETDRRIRHA